MADASKALTIGVTDVDEPPEQPDPPEVARATVNPRTEEPGNWLHVTWTEPANPGPPITGYRLHYLQLDQEPVPEFGLHKSPSTETETFIEGVVADGNYEVRVRAVNHEGASLRSEPGSIPTPLQSPAPNPVVPDPIVPDPVNPDPVDNDPEGNNNGGNGGDGNGGDGQVRNSLGPEGPASPGENGNAIDVLLSGPT